MEPNKDMNCWEYKNCPEDRKKACPAFITKSGKKCWIVTGTMCGGVKQGTMQEKLAKCHECVYFKARDGIPG